MKRLLLRLIPLWLEHLGVHLAVVPLEPFWCHFGADCLLICEFTYARRKSSQETLQMKRLLVRLIPLWLEHLGVHFAVVPLGDHFWHFTLLCLLAQRGEGSA